jgi:Tfp pilus assembly PilM family ATPase
MSIFGQIVNPNYPKAALGLEQSRAAVVSLRRSRGGFGVKQAAATDLPDGLLNPTFLGSNIADVGELAAYLGETAEAAGLRRQKKWSVSLPGNTARAAIITLDSEPASHSELEEVLGWKAERSFGSPVAEMRVTWEKLAADTSHKSRYFAAAVRYDALDEFEGLFGVLGWHVGLLLPRYLGEAYWLMQNEKQQDSLLVSLQNDGFNAVLLRQGAPNVVRSVTCSQAELDDEIYRLLMFYRDRVAATAFAGTGGALEKILVVGAGLNTARLNAVGQEALGRALRILRPEEVGLDVAIDNISFADLAAPAGLARLSWA